MATYTQYRVTYQGGTCIDVSTLAEADYYITLGVEMRGNKREDYAIQSRTHTISEWAPVG